MDRLPSDSIWYVEALTPDLMLALGVRRVLYEGDTEYQHVQLLETVPFGRALILDGRTQSTETDEWVYHEGLVQPVMAAHENPRRVFIAGGGEGATAREVLRHLSVTDVVMVDLDREVVDLCRRYLPKHHQGAFDDPRLSLLHEDAQVYLQTQAEPFDIIVIDVPDPLERGPAWLLYTQEFYALVKSRLRPGGLVVVQAGPAGPTGVTEVFTPVVKTMASVFATTHACRVFVPSFGTMWGFAVGGLDDSPDVGGLAAEEIDRRLAARLSSELAFYDGVTHQGMFALPKYIRTAMAKETRVITDHDPLYAV